MPDAVLESGLFLICYVSSAFWDDIVSYSVWSSHKGVLLGHVTNNTFVTLQRTNIILKSTYIKYNITHTVV